MHYVIVKKVSFERLWTKCRGVLRRFEILVFWICSDIPLKGGPLHRMNQNSKSSSWLQLYTQCHEDRFNRDKYKILHEGLKN